MPEGNLSCTGQTLGEGALRVDRCCSSCLTLGEALAEGFGRYESWKCNSGDTQMVGEGTFYGGKLILSLSLA